MGCVFLSSFVVIMSPSIEKQNRREIQGGEIPTDWPETLMMDHEGTDGEEVAAYRHRQVLRHYSDLRSTAVVGSCCL
jgi:hypothetical protein